MFRSKIFRIVLVALALVAAGAGFYYYNNVYLQAQEPEAETIATGTVTRGDLVITASGSGTLVPSTELAVGFRSGGRVAEVLVARLSST